MSSYTSLYIVTAFLSTRKEEARLSRLSVLVHSRVAESPLLSISPLPSCHPQLKNPHLHHPLVNDRIDIGNREGVVNRKSVVELW